MKYLCIAVFLCAISVALVAGVQVNDHAAAQSKPGGQAPLTFANQPVREIECNQQYLRCFVTGGTLHVELDIRSLEQHEREKQ